MNHSSREFVPGIVQTWEEGSFARSTTLLIGGGICSKDPLLFIKRRAGQG